MREKSSAVTAVPNNGYKFVEWSGGVNTAERIDKNITSDLSVKAIFEKISYTLKYEADENGAISGKCIQNVDINADGETVKAIPFDGYRFVKWSDGVNTAERIDKNITNDLSVKAIFEKISYTLKYEADENGAISGKCIQNVDINADGETVKAIPFDGYRFVEWSDGVNTAERIDKNITADKTVKAIFEKSVFTVKYETDGNGIIDGNATQTVAYRENSTKVTARPYTGYKFVAWSDGIRTSYRQDKNISSDKTVTAIFEKIKYSITFTAGVGGTIEGKAQQQVKYAELSEEVVAVPQTGYRFVKWSNGYEYPTLRWLALSDITLTAEFEFLFEGGNGTQMNPYTIANHTQLNNMRYYPQSDYKLINDLDLNGVSHEPIFYYLPYFSGNFNGGGHTIYNLTVKTDLNYPSLFGVINGGTVSDLNLVNAEINNTDYDITNKFNKYYVGILAGEVRGSVKNVTASGKIVVVNGPNDIGITVGGLIGFDYGIVADCSCDVQLNIKNARSYSYFGGMIGKCDSANIINCETQGKINITDSSYNIYVGGLIGYYSTEFRVITETEIINEFEIINSQTNILITDNNSTCKAGGFVGYLTVNQNTSLQIINCSVYGNITSGDAGGFIYEGYSSAGDLLIENCIVENEIQHTSTAAGFIKFYTGKNCTIRNCHATCVMETTIPPQSGGSEGWGFAYNVSRINFINCYSSGSIYSARGGGFVWALSNCIVEQCYSDNDIYTYFSSSAFATVSINSEIINCYSKNNYINEPIYNTNVPLSVIRILRNSKISNFYYSGNLIEKVFKEVTNSEITNFHCLKSDKLTEELIEVDRGDEPSSIDITVYEKPEDMYYLADKLNEGLTKDIWKNQDNDFPKLIPLLQTSLKTIVHDREINLDKGAACRC